MCVSTPTDFELDVLISSRLAVKRLYRSLCRSVPSCTDWEIKGQRSLGGFVRLQNLPDSSVDLLAVGGTALTGP